MQPARAMLLKGVMRRMKTERKIRLEMLVGFGVSSFEKQRRAVTNIKTEAANALQTSGESLEEHESKNDQFGHFIAIVRVRRALLEALTKKTNKDFMQHVEDLNAKSLSLAASAQGRPRANTRLGAVGGCT